MMKYLSPKSQLVTSHYMVNKMIRSDSLKVKVDIYQELPNSLGKLCHIVTTDNSFVIAITFIWLVKHNKHD